MGSINGNGSGLSRYCGLKHLRKQIYSVSLNRKMLNLSDLTSKFHIIAMFVTANVKCATHNGHVCLGSTASYRHIASVPHQLWLPNRKPRNGFEPHLRSSFTFYRRKVKCQITTVRAIKTYWNRGMAPPILKSRR
jgi:hypothetical protein